MTKLLFIQFNFMTAIGGFIAIFAILLMIFAKQIVIRVGQRRFKDAEQDEKGEVEKKNFSDNLFYGLKFIALALAFLSAVLVLIIG